MNKKGILFLLGLFLFLGYISQNSGSGMKTATAYSTTDWCYQETATTATSCGGLNNGIYSCSGDWSVLSPCTNVYDGDWGTFGASNLEPAYLYINYTKPSNILNTSLWRVKDENADYPNGQNFTIFSTCWNQNPLQFRIYSIHLWEVLDHRYDCWDGDSWEPIYDAPGRYIIFEEAMWWDIAQPTKQRIAIPSYFYPGNLWTRMNNAYPTAGIAIINPTSGAGNSKDENYANQVINSQASGLKVLGYSHTSYSNRNIQDAKSDIDKYYSWYNVDGLFIDEVTTDCGKIAYYTELKNYIKSKDNDAIIVINPGTQTNECYMAVGDIVVNFENTYNIYRNKYFQPSWVAGYPSSRFWHLVHTTNTIQKMNNAVQLSKNRNAGWVYVTPDVLPNPWDTLPPIKYWNTELDAVNN